MVRLALTALAELLGSPQLNLWVRTAPRGGDEFHWHVDILPRLTIRAGFEMGTGVEVDIYPPERAAADLRRVISWAAAFTAHPTLHRGLRAGEAPVRPLGGAAAGRVRGRVRPAVRGGGDGARPGNGGVVPERAWGGRVYVPVTGRGESRRRTRSSTSVTSPSCGRTRTSRGAARHRRFHRRRRGSESGWQIDLNDAVIGAWRTDGGRVGDVTLV